MGDRALTCPQCSCQMSEYACEKYLMRVHPGNEKSFVVTFEEPGVRMIRSVFKVLRDLETGYKWDD
jgi:hypothetical protein